MIATAPVRSSAARELALRVVRDVFGADQRGAQAAFDYRARRTDLAARDRAFAAELAYGSIKLRRLLDWYLAPYIGQRKESLPPAILEILRLGIYQVRCMSGVDDHAAVFETVNLALHHGHRGTAGLVNAVLRRFIADVPAAPERSTCASEDEYLGLSASLPNWVAAHLRHEFEDRTPAIVRGINAAPQHAICVNGGPDGVGEIEAELNARGLAMHRSQFVADILIGDAPGGDDPAGRWVLQSESAGMPVDLLDPRRGERVADLCSGRGNKALQIASRLANEGTIACIELDARKARALEARLSAAGVRNAGVRSGDAGVVEGGADFDAVLLDAPCSGLGIIGRHPEARWRKSITDGARLALRQRALLRAAAARVRPGGRLVYSVCSTDPREGRDVVTAFAAESPEFIRSPLPERYQPLTRNDDVLVPPGIDGRDGFFIARFVRRCFSG